MTQTELINKYTERIMIDYPEADKIHIDLMQFAEELRQCNVVGRSEQLVCSCGSRLVKTTGGYHCGNAKCSV